MNYEKRYKEALERAKDMLSYKEVRREDIEHLFPELKESEDEKIRKALLEMVHDTTGDDLWIDYNVHKEDVIAWLEKQGKQKPSWSEEDESMLKDAIEFIETGWSDKGKSHLVYWLKSLKQRIGG